MATKANNRNRPPEELQGATTKAKRDKKKAADAEAAAEAQRVADLQEVASRKPEVFGADFGGKRDLHPARYPEAISHDSVFHDNLFTHISNLRARLDGAVASGSKPIMELNRTLQGHLKKAEDEGNLSWAAHKAGTEGGVAGFHTAVEAYRRAHEHLSNAHRVLVQGLGLTSDALAKHLGKNPDLPLLTADDRTTLIHGYTTHVADSAKKKGITLPNGVAVKKDVNLSDLADPQEVLRPGVAYSRQLSGKTPKSDAEIAAGKARSVFNQGLMRLQTSGGAGTRTREQIEGARRAADEGVAIDPFKLPEKMDTPHSGVGITGFNTLVSAAKLHYEYHNPGKKWSESTHSKDPMAYAVKHKVAFPDQVATTAKVLRNMGLDKEEDSAGAIVGGSYKEKAEKPVGREIPLSAAVDAKPPKKSRNAEFRITGGNN